MRILNTIKRVVDTILKYLSIVILGVMTIMVVYQVFARQVLGTPSVIAEFVSQYLFVWSVILGGALMFGLREHLNVTILKDKFSPLWNMIMEIFIHLVLLAFVLPVLIMGGLRYVEQQMNTTDAALQIPFGVIVAVLPIAGFLMVFYALYNCALAVSEYREIKLAQATGEYDTPEYQEAAQEREDEIRMEQIEEAGY